ncbi:MAG: hypothetical protein IJ035_06785 [Oscillospiraceae bacterium]|nr:hypothetical protein [Oscillospiraceae bacterium]
MVGVLGAKPTSRRPQTAKCFPAPAGAACEALRKGEFATCCKEGRPAREGVPNSNEVAAFV